MTAPDPIQTSRQELQARINGLRYVADAEDRRRPHGGLGFRQEADRLALQLDEGGRG